MPDIHVGDRVRVKATDAATELRGKVGVVLAVDGDRLTLDIDGTNGYVLRARDVVKEAKT